MMFPSGKGLIRSSSVKVSPPSRRPPEDLPLCVRRCASSSPPADAKQEAASSTHTSVLLAIDGQLP